MASEHLFHMLEVPDKKNTFVELFKILTMKYLEEKKLQRHVLFSIKHKQL